MHPHGPQKTFNWPQGGDSCYVPIKNIVCAIQTPITTTGRTYRICNEDYDKTVAWFAKLHSWTPVDFMLWKHAMMYFINLWIKITIATWKMNIVINFSNWFFWFCRKMGLDLLILHWKQQDRMVMVCPNTKKCPFLKLNYHLMEKEQDFTFG